MSSKCDCRYQFEERASALKTHYSVQNPKFIYGISEIPMDAKTGDYFNGVFPA